MPREANRLQNKISKILLLLSHIMTLGFITFFSAIGKVNVFVPLYSPPLLFREMIGSVGLLNGLPAACEILCVIRLSFYQSSLHCNWATRFLLFSRNNCKISRKKGITPYEIAAVLCELSDNESEGVCYLKMKNNSSSASDTRCTIYCIW